MEIKQLSDSEALAAAVTEKIKETVHRNPEALLCIAGGDTPLPMIKQLVLAEQNGEIDFSNCSFVSLDEWVGISGETKGSCFQTLDEHLFSKLKTLSKKNICFFDGKAANLAKECQRVNQFIENKGGLDFIVLGIGMNAHIGFNEPGVQVELAAHVVELDQTTKQVMNKYFEQELPLEQGITLGMKQILASGEIAMIATGQHKAAIIQRIVTEAPTTELPASLIKESRGIAILYLDKQAAGKIV